MAKKSIASKYVRLTPIEHVLTRPDTYVGSINSEEKDMYVIEDTTLKNINVIKKIINYNPAFVKLFDEAIVNASDQAIRTAGSKNSVKIIKITIDKEKISIENDGESIPIELHPTEKIYNAELIFSNLLTGQNFDDTEERTVGGKNGMGVKLVNIFSKKFIVDTCDGKKKYKQIVKENMQSIGKPTVKDVESGTKSYTKITYYPDVERFGLKEIDEDSISLMIKRCLDIAVYNPKVRVIVNSKTIPVKSVKDYMQMHLPEGEEFFYEKLENGWEVGIAKSKTEQFEQVSIVNGINTYRGGTHINFTSLQVAKDVTEKFKRGTSATWADVKNRLFMFLISAIPNPEFDTQTKESLTKRITTDIHQNSKVGDTTIKKIMKSDIVASILREIEVREMARLKRQQKLNAKVKVEKLVDANSKDRSNCQLFIFEGDCLEENTKIKIIRDEAILDIPIKNVEIDDVVITHKNRFGSITSVNKKISKKNIIKTKLGDIECSKVHKWFVYDRVEEKFYFTETKNIDKDKHKLVKNYLAFISSLKEIKTIKQESNVKYDLSIEFTNGDVILMTNSHKSACYSLETDEFIMLEASKLDKDKHLLLNISEGDK